MSQNHEPVCAKCRLPMYPRKNGVWVIDVVDCREFAVWSADKWRCPRCKAEIIIGFGRQPVAQGDDDFVHMLDHARTQSHTYECDWTITGERSLDENREWEIERTLERNKRI